MDQYKGITRRDFIKSTTLATAAVLVPHQVLAVETGSSKPNSQRLLDGWEHFRGSLGGSWDIWRGEKSRWHQVTMPHCFNARDAVDPDELYYRGPGWYRISLIPNNPFPAGRTLLHFEGAGQRTRVFVGLDQVGEHAGGYDEFVVDITDAAAKLLHDPAGKGAVPVGVLCDNSRDLESSPSDSSDFNLYGGLYRYVNLVYMPAVSLERVHISPVLDADGSGKASIQGRLYNPASATDRVQVSIRVLDPDGKTVHSVSQSLDPWQGMQELTAFKLEKPQSWSPAKPALYRCEVTVSSGHGDTTVTERFGFRRFEFVQHGPFLLNGERLLLHGTQRHEDHAGLGAAVPEEITIREMHMIREMGANFIRLAHYQQSRVVLDLCDELGIMVWEEIPWCRSGIGGDRWQNQVRGMLNNMIDQHYNHPSVIFWGLGNENDWPGEYPEQNQQKIRGFLQELHGTAHRLDPSRVTSIRRCDFSKDIIDVYSPSIWAGWYRGRYTEYKGSVQSEMAKVNHFIHIEWGGDSQARRHSEDPYKSIANVATGHGTDERGFDYLPTGGLDRASRDGDWSETYICDLFDWHLKEQETMPSLTGSAQWIFKDFSTPERPENPVPKVNQKGLVERDLTPKEGYYVFQSYWSEKPMVHIYGHSWPVRWGDENQRRWVKVYSNCESVELFLNGASQGVKRRNSQDFPAAGLRWSLPFHSGENHLRAVARKGNSTITDEISFIYDTKKWGAPAALELKESKRDGETVTVEARMLDANGLFCLDARDRIRFGITGDGTLIDNLGTNRAARVVELCNGRAEISLLRNGGKSEVSVSAKGIPTAFVTVA